MKSESELTIPIPTMSLITVCNKCSELLNHKVINSDKCFEVRVGVCPDCEVNTPCLNCEETKHKYTKMIEKLLGVPDLNFDELDDHTREVIKEAWELLNEYEE